MLIVNLTYKILRNKIGRNLDTCNRFLKSTTMKSKYYIHITSSSINKLRRVTGSTDKDHLYLVVSYRGLYLCRDDSLLRGNVMLKVTLERYFCNLKRYSFAIKNVRIWQRANQPKRQKSDCELC
jgi:hypothetical protein